MRSALITLALAAALSAALPARASADTPLQEAQRHYSAGDYAAAEGVLTRAIQANPLQRDYYLGLARTLNLMERFEEAAFVYMLYLNHADLNSSGDRPSQRVLQEYAGVQSEREHPERAPAPPETQEAALTVLEERMETGPIVSGRAGDAWGFLETLLRTGYARPELQLIRENLADSLRRELLTASPLDATLLPSLSWEGWELQELRLERLRQLDEELSATNPEYTPRAEGLDLIDHLATGQLKALQGEHEAALAAFKEAVATAPDSAAALTGLLNVYDSRRTNNAETDQALSTLRRLICERQEHIDVLLYYNALFADSDEAVERASQDIARWFTSQMRHRQERSPHPVCSLQRGAL